jgi:hypothetical protein
VEVVVQWVRLVNPMDRHRSHLGLVAAVENHIKYLYSYTSVACKAV